MDFLSLCSYARNWSQYPEEVVNGTPPHLVSMTVEPQFVITATPKDQIISIEEATKEILLSSNIEGITTFHWVAHATNVIGAESVSGKSIPSQILTALPKTSGKVNYTITPSLTGAPSTTGCACGEAALGKPVNVTVIVNTYVPVPKELVKKKDWKSHLIK